MKFNIITLFPELFANFTQTLPLKRGIQQGTIEVKIINLRDYAVDKRGTVDDKIYGGGTGMLLRLEPIVAALEANSLKKDSPNAKIILTAPSGTVFDHSKALGFSKLKEITFICGRYEGIDARIENFIDEKISIGKYVLSGGELPTLIMMEATSRLISGILTEEATSEDSFFDNWVEYPQYTRPENFRGFKVPDVLINGNHEEIRKWRQDNKTPSPK